MLAGGASEARGFSPGKPPPHGWSGGVSQVANLVVRREAESCGDGLGRRRLNHLLPRAVRGTLYHADAHPEGPTVAVREYPKGGIVSRRRAGPSGGTSSPAPILLRGRLDSLWISRQSCGYGRRRTSPDRWGTLVQRQLCRDRVRGWSRADERRAAVHRDGVLGIGGGNLGVRHQEPNPLVALLSGERGPEVVALSQPLEDALRLLRRRVARETVHDELFL